MTTRTPRRCPPYTNTFADRTTTPPPATERLPTERSPDHHAPPTHLRPVPRTPARRHGTGLPRAGRHARYRRTLLRGPPLTAARTREDRPGAAPLPEAQGPRQAPPRRHHRRPQLRGPPGPRLLARAAPLFRTVDQGRPDCPRHRRHRIRKVLPRLRPRPPSLPQRHLHPLLPPLAAPRRTHPRPRRWHLSHGRPAAREDQLGVVLPRV